MQKVILYIQPQIVGSVATQDFVRVDLMEEELITLTQVIQDVKDIEKLFTDYSKTFNLPASKTNNKLFKYWFNPDVNGFNNQIFSTAKIELNHFEFKKGEIQLNEVVMKDNKPSMYKVTFFGETTNFKNAINEDQLSDLVWLNKFNHSIVYDANNNVKAGLQFGLNITADGVVYNDAIIYPLIAHSLSYIYDTSNTNNPVNIANNSGNHTKRGVLPEDLKPAITIRLILKAIENQYNIIFKTGEFFDSAALTNLYMWLHREKGKMILNKSQVFNNIASSCSATTTPSCTAMTDPTYIDTSFPNQATQNDQFRGWFDLTNSVFNFLSDLTKDFENTVFTVNTDAASNPNVFYTIEIIRLNNMEVFARSENNQGVSSLSVTMFKDNLNNGFNPTGNPLNVMDLYLFSAANNFDPNQFAVRIITNDDLFVGVSYTITRVYTDTDSNPNSPTFGQTTTTNYNGSFSNLAYQSINTQFVTITDQMPKLKVKDFLNGLFRQFNLIAYLSYQGQIIVEPLDTYYAGGGSFDITKYVKTDQHTIGESIPFSEVGFEYTKPKSILAEQFFLVNNKKYGKLNFLSGASKKNIYEIKLPFEQMIFERLFNLANATATDVQVGTFMDTELKPSIGAPLMFYGIYQQPDEGTVINFVNTYRKEDGSLPEPADNYSLPTYWIPSVCNELGTSTTAPTHNLNFGSEINTFTFTDYGGVNNSLFQTYYENYITRLFNSRIRIFKFKAILPLRVLINLTLDDLITIGTRTYTINKMTTKLQSGETSFELLNEPN